MIIIMGNWMMETVLIFLLGLDPILQGMTLSLEESGPRFLEEWSPSYSFSSRLGGNLRCGVHGSPHPHVEWVSRDGVPLENITGLREVLPTGNIRFLPFPTEKFRPDLHVGVGLRCKASNPSGTIISPEIVVRAVLDTPFHIENPDVTVIRGNNAILRCLVASELLDFISVTSWVQDGSLNIYPNFQTGKWLMLPSGALILFNVDDSDARKTWACRTLHKLTNEVTTSDGAKIVMKEPTGPQIVRILGERERNIRARAGEEIHLFCNAEGNPPPSFAWFRESDGVLSDLNFPVKRPSQNTVHLPQIRPEDSGSYICQGNNSHSVDQATIQVTVYVPLRVQVSPSSQIVDVGRGASLRCLVSGSPVTSLFWYKDGVPLNVEQDEGGGQTLKLFRVHPDDAGMYQCFASNDMTTAQDSAQIRLGSVLPELSYRFSEQTIQPGPSVSLKCTAVGNPPPQFVWKLDGFPLPNSERYMVGQYVTIHDNVISHVNITNAREDDGGLYECEARNGMGSIGHRARLNIYGPPFVRQVPPIKGVAGKSAQIQCPVSGYPIESITWERGGSGLPVTRMQRVYPNGTLILEHLQKMDEGILTCTARGRQGQASSRDIHLRVVVPPKLMPFQFLNSVLREGMRAAVSCQLLEGDRPIDLIWEFDGKPLTGVATNGITIRIPDEYSSTLVIDSLSSVHNGKYTCIAENMAGRETYSSELTVQIPPKWTLEPRDVNVSSGSSLSLSCKTEGHPLPIITWKKAMGKQPGEYRDISVGSGGSSSNYPGNNGTLRFDQVKKSDEGNYLCEARNGVGSGLSKVVYVKVNAPAHFLEKDHGTGSNQISVRVGEKAVLSCRVGGDLPIQVEWGNKHGKVGTHSNHRYTFREKELEPGLLSEMLIASVDRSDSGAYSCRASNPFGTDHIILNLNVQEPPEQPGNLRIVEVGSRSVGISWLENFNGNSPLINFIIQSKFPSETWTEAEVEELAVPATQSTALVEGLTPSTTYQLRVLAQNGVGFSPPSEVVQVTTTEEPPEGPPLEVNVDAETSTRLRVRWAPPERSLWHGQILGYYLGYRELSLALVHNPVLLDEGGVDNVPDGFSRSHASNIGDLHGYHFKTVEVGSDFGGETIIENLRKFSRYAIVVQAFNGKGAGPSSAARMATTLQDVPSLPPEKFECRPSSPQSLALTWDLPPIESRHGIIQGYKVQYVALEMLEGDEEISMETKVTTERDLVLHGLRKWTNYSVTVIAFTVVGEGAVSLPILCETEEDVPPPPSELKAVVASRRTILLSWLPPINPNGKVTTYTIYSRISDATKVEKKSASFPNVNFEWVGLKEGTTYEFWISCTTRVGEGTPTPRIKAITATNNKVPARISSFGGTVQVAWKKEFGLDCIAVGMPDPVIKWNFNGMQIHAGGKREVLPTNKLLIKDVGVEDAGNYTCSATNAHGTEDAHYSVKVTTPPQAPTLQVVEVAHNSLRLQWSTPHSGGSRVKGYVISFRRESGEWEETEVGGRDMGHTLQHLLCGSTYQLYITANNKIGSGPASDILTKRTKGQAPISPKMEEALLSNHSTIVIRLDLWKDSGCSIHRFMIEYKPANDKSWMRIPTELNGSAKSYTLTGLHAKTRYEIRVTGGNDAGETVAKYEFLTGSNPHKSNEAIAPSNIYEESGVGESGDRATHSPLVIILPSLLSLALVIGVIGFFCYMKRKRILGIPATKTTTVLTEGNLDNPYLHDACGRGGQGPSDPQSSQQHYTLVKGAEGRYLPDLTAPYSKGKHAGVEDYGDDVCPYATFQLPDNPPVRPLLTKGMSGGGGYHTGDTLYNVGNVYSGPYHAVQSQNYKTATLSRRDNDYLTSGRTKVRPLEDDDAEVKKIMSLHMPLSEYDVLDGEDETSPKYHHPHHHSSYHPPNSHHQHHPHLAGRQGVLLQQQEMATFRQHNNRSDPTSEQSSSSTEESSPTRRFKKRGGLYSSGRNKSTSGSSNSGVLPRVRSSSGYSSSHAEETSFTSSPGAVFGVQPPPPSQFSDGNRAEMEEIGDVHNKQAYSASMKRSKRSGGHKNKGNFHIHV